MKCQAETKSGSRCKNNALADSQYCHVHKGARARAKNKAPSFDTTVPKDWFDSCMKFYEIMQENHRHYYKLYMQSWVVFGVAILAGGILTVGDAPDDPKNGAMEGVASLVPCFVPLLSLIWFLLTSYYWVHFELLERRLAALEERMKKNCAEFGGACPDYYSRYHIPFFSGRPYSGWINAWFLVLGAVMYLALSWSASTRASQLVDPSAGSSALFCAMLASYVAACVVTMTLILVFWNCAGKSARLETLRQTIVGSRRSSHSSIAKDTGIEEAVIARFVNDDGIITSAVASELTDYFTRRDRSLSK